MGWKGYVVGGVLGATCLGGAFLVEYLDKPTVAYTIDLDGDGTPDLILKNRIGEKSYLLGRGDKTYMSVGEMQKEGLKMIENELQSKREEQMKMFTEGWNKTKKTIEEKLKTIR